MTGERPINQGTPSSAVPLDALSASHHHPWGKERHTSARDFARCAHCRPGAPCSDFLLAGGMMEIRERSIGSVVCLDLQGRLVTTVDDGRLTDKVNSLLFEGRRHILLNLEDVSGIDTSGLSSLIAIRRATDEIGGRIKLLNLPSRILDLLVVTKLITLFDIVESEADAIRAFSVDAPSEVTEN